MPQKNTLKIFVPDSYYHIYARGASKQPVFIDAADYKYFLALFERYLGSEQQLSKTGQVYPTYRGDLHLLAYCLMKNHFHLLVYQDNERDIEKFMRSLMTSYARYFNLRYKRSGQLFESRYKAKRIADQTYLEHISRYIHLNPRGYETYRYSSYQLFVGRKQMPGWMNSDKIYEIVADPDRYAEFVADYKDVRDILEEIKHDLADK